MASIHNVMIRSFNSIIYYAPNVTPEEVPSFMRYCQAAARLVHEHHSTEEEVAFPYLESKLGKGSMEANVTQHQDFMPKFDQWSDFCAKILAKEVEYRPTEFVELLRQSTDVLHIHLVDEIATLESSILRNHFTEDELRNLEVELLKKVHEKVTLWDIPLMLVNGDVSFNSWFPDFPAPVLFLVRHVLMNLPGGEWKYGQSDKYLRLKDESRSMYGL